MDECYDRVMHTMYDKPCTKYILICDLDKDILMAWMGLCLKYECVWINVLKLIGI